MAELSKIPYSTQNLIDGFVFIISTNLKNDSKKTLDDFKEQITEFGELLKSKFNYSHFDSVFRAHPEIKKYEGRIVDNTVKPKLK